MDIFEYTDYRIFLLDRIEFEKLSVERFAKKYSKQVSKVALDKLLGRNRLGSGFNGSYKMSNERFTELLYELRPKLSEDQIYRLCILKIIQDGSRNDKGEASKMSKLLSKRAFTAETSIPKKERFSTTALDLALEGISLLPQTMRKNIESELVARLVTSLARLGDAAEVARMIRKLRPHLMR